MEVTSFADMKEKLEEFQKEKNELCQDFNEKVNLNNGFEYWLACSMAAIFYEYKRIITNPFLKAWKPDENLKTKEGREKALINYVEQNFNKREIHYLAKSLGLLKENGTIDISSIMTVIPKIEELAKPVLDEIEQFKANLKEKFLKHKIEFKHISPVDIKDGKINPSVNLENQPQNELVIGVFATSSYESLMMYACRAVSGGMIVNKEGIFFPINRNPFAPIDKQDNPEKIKLSKPVYAYSISPEGFEPQVHFKKDKKGFHIEFDDEWVLPTEKGVNFLEQETLSEVSSEPFLTYKTFCKDFKSGMEISITNILEKKFGIRKRDRMKNNNIEP